VDAGGLRQPGDRVDTLPTPPRLRPRSGPLFPRRQVSLLLLGEGEGEGEGERTDKRGSVAWPSSRLSRSTSSRARRQQTKLRRAGRSGRPDSARSASCRPPRSTGGLGRGEIASVATTWAAVGSRAVEATERMCQNPGWPHSKASGVV